MTYLVYDLDGTLVTSSKEITDDMINVLSDLQKNGYKNVLVTGGEYKKVLFQLRNRIDLFDMIFTECGAVLNQKGIQIYKKDIVSTIDTKLLENIYDKFLDMCDKINYTEKTEKYTGNRVDKRNGLVYLTPVGMEANNELRSDFIQYENETNFRDKLIPKLKELDIHNQVEIVKGGKTGVSVYPTGIDKTQILKYIPKSTIYFFGDNCQIGGNDYPLFIHSRCKGFEINNYKHCINLLTNLFTKR